MKYCMNFDKNSKYVDEVDELVIHYHANESEVALIPFLDSRPEQTIILFIGDFTAEQEPKIIKVLEDAANHKNLKIGLLPGGFAPDLIDTLLELEIPYFLTRPLQTIEEIYQYAGFGVSEVTLGTSLGFQLDKVKNVADKLNLKTRINYNCITTGDPLQLELMEPYWQFFIRPEDVDLYGTYLDTIVIPAIEPISFSDGIYKAYQEKKWNGKLSELFLFIPEDYDNRFMAPVWGERRVHCNRRCMYVDNCHICETIKKLSHTLEEANIVIPADIRGAHETAASADPLDQSSETLAELNILGEKYDKVPKITPAF